MPTKKPARMIEMAFAPTAGANGVEPDEPAPIDQAMKKLDRTAATRTAGETIWGRSGWR